MCTWSLSGNLLNKVHHGAPIWSIDISKDSKRIFTGGADGSVYMWQTTRHINPKIISLPNIDTHSNPKFISYLKNGTLLIFNESGMLFCYDKEKILRTRYSLSSETQRNYYIMQVSPNRSFIAFASREGYVTIYQGTNICHDINININEMRIIVFASISFLSLKFSFNQIIKLKCISGFCYRVCVSCHRRENNGITNLFFALVGTR